MTFCAENIVKRYLWMAGFDIKKFKEQQLKALKRLQNNPKSTSKVFSSKIELSNSIFEDTIQNITESNNPLIQSLNEQLQNAGYETKDILTILDSDQDGRLTSEEMSYLSNLDGDDKLTSDDFEKFIEEATSKETQEAILNIEADAASIEQLREIASKYTQREDLTPEEYCQIITINQLENVFKNTYSKYTDQLDTEGWIDDVYNGLKNLTGLGITREMVEAEFNSHFNTTKALSAIINQDYETSDEILKEEFIRKVNEESEGNVIKQFYAFIEYFQDEDIAIEKFNDFMAQSINYTLTPTFIEVGKTEDGDYLITIGGNEPEKISDIENAGMAPSLNFWRKLDENTITDENFYSSGISRDFESVYKYLTGAEYNPEYIEDYIQKNYMYSTANMGYYSAYQMQEILSEKPVEEIFAEFLNLNNGDINSAIESFNNYYDSILNGKDSKDLILKNAGSEGTISSVEVRLNQQGEIEYVMKIEPDKNFAYLIYTMGNYNEENGTAEIVYNPSKLAELAEEKNYKALSDYTDLSNIFEISLNQINQSVKSNNILCNRYAESFEEANGLSLEEVSNQYFESYSRTLGDSDLQNILNSYINDMDSYADKLSAIISIGSIGLSFICPAFGIGALVGAGIDNAIDGINMATNSTKDDWNSWIQETVFEATMIAVGLGIGKQASQIGSNAKNMLLGKGLSLKSASIAGTAVETLTDVGLSMGADYLITGDFNLNGNSFAGFLDIISGIRGYKALASIYSDSYTYEADEILEGFVSDAAEPQKLLEDGTPRGVSTEYIEGSFVEGDDTISSDVIETITYPNYRQNDVIYVEPQKQLTEKITISPEDLSAKMKDFGTDAELVRETNPYTYYATKSYNDAIQKAINEGRPVSLDNILAAEDVIAKGDTYTQIEDFASQLAEEHSSGTYTVDTLSEIAEHLGFEISGDISKNSNGIYTANADSATITARAKGTDSILSKLKNKILDLKTEVPESITDAKALVGDSQGVRIIIQTEKITSDTISKLDIPGLEKQDAELLGKYLEGNLTDIPKEKIEFFKSIEKDVCSSLAEMQAQSFVDNLCESIIDGDIIISEINNYSGPDGIPYLSATQIEKIQKAYAQWYQEIYEFTVNNPGKNQYEIRLDENNVPYLFDTISQTKFMKEIPTKSATITTNNKGIKTSGYTGAQFNIVNSFGQQTELQFRGSVLNQTAETEHIIYDIMNDKETVSGQIYDDLRDALGKISQIDSSNGNTQLIDEFQRYYNDIYIASRKQELGLKVELPDIKDYTLLISNLTNEEIYTISLEGVLDLHARVEAMKHANK